jgi:hypothetical protein
MTTTEAQAPAAATDPALDAANLLRTAADLVDRATALLDTTRFSPCECCGSKRFANVMQARASERIARTPEQLRDVAAKLVESLTS